MCIALMGQVVAVGPDSVQVQAGRRLWQACALFFPDLKAGDYVLFSRGVVVDRLDPDEARERAAVFESMLEVPGETP